MDVSPDEKQRIREKIEKLKQSKFKQQTLPAWRPVPTAMSTMFTFSIFSVVFLAIGIVLYVMSDQITELEKRYDILCEDYIQDKDDRQCEITFDTLSSKVEGPVYVYYQLDNFYQNHRRYVKSRDNEQLAGTYKDDDKLSGCDPIIYNKDLWKNQQISVSGKQLNAEDPAIPCGLVAKSFFNDTFEMYKVTDAGAETKVDIKNDNIAWTSDVTYKFANIEKGPKGEDWKDLQWLNMKDPHFIVWMRTAGLPNFRKLWGRIPQGLEAGTYKLKINNNYQVAPFQGSKSFVISTTNALGGKNYFLAICYITVGVLCMLFSLVFCIAYMKKRNNSNANA